VTLPTVDASAAATEVFPPKDQHAERTEGVSSATRQMGNHGTNACRFNTFRWPFQSRQGFQFNWIGNVDHSNATIEMRAH
jgi:hypothetical protein